MYEELVKRLRADSFVCNSCIEKRRCKNEDHICVLKNQLQAAKAIEKLEAKNKELESKLHDSFTEHLLNQISRKEKQLEQAKVEREAFLNEKAEREKGCDFCNSEYVVMSGSRMSSELIHKGCAAKFCPNCGKRLVSEE